MTETAPRHALISVSDKTGLDTFARALADQGFTLLSTGGTARALREAGLEVTDISDFTGFPEILDGRVKTLHPRVHAGLLYRRDTPTHVETMAREGLAGIDVVCVNLYPFEATVANPEVTWDEAIEQIDIGGPTLIRAAAKNMEFVTVVTDPADYGRVTETLADGGEALDMLRRELGIKAFARISAYDAAIANWLCRGLPESAEEGASFSAVFTQGRRLRYGENPHQEATLYLEPRRSAEGIAGAEVLHGKEMSYNNYLDGDAAVGAARELAGGPGAVVIKHSNPCGMATGATLAEALAAAWDGDPVSAFGSVIALTQTVDAGVAEFLAKRFVEVVIAPDYEPDALARLRRKKQIRLLRLPAVGKPPGAGLDLRQVGGGLLVQDRDLGLAEMWTSPTSASFPEDKMALAEFGVKVVKHVKSNAIVLVREQAPGQFSLLGMGAGQPNRVDSVRKLALARAQENLEAMHEANPSYGSTLADFTQKALSECVLVSDAFFPFPDSVEHAAEAGIRLVVQPGGSVKDEEVIAACDRLGVAMCFTAMRHFRH